MTGRVHGEANGAMRSPRQWWKEEMFDLNPLLAVIVAANGWVSDDDVARSLCLIAALAILRGKL